MSFRVRSRLAFIVLSVLGGSALAVEKGTVTEVKWFKKIPCEQVRIVEYASAGERKVVRERTISDPEFVRSFQSAINQLPVKGEELVKMGPAADYLVLEFTCGSDVETVEFYNRSIKTPDTSFYAQGRPEAALWDEIQSLFKRPVLGKPAPKVEGAELDFGEFSIRFLGSEDRTPPGTTATRVVESYRVTSGKDGSTQTVEVASGQLPPAPQEFKVGSAGFVLYTFAKKNGTRLPPRSLLIERRR